MDLLIDAITEIQQRFPEPTFRVEVEREIYPEGTLNLYIQTNLSAKDAFETLKKFDDEWWIRRIHGSRLSIHIEFKD